MNEQSEPDERLLQRIQRLLDAKERPALDREELRRSMRRQAEENEALVMQGSAQTATVARARARIFAHMRENGLLSVFGPLVAVLSTLKNRTAYCKVQVARGLNAASVTVQSAGAVVAAAIAVTTIIAAGQTVDPSDMAGRVGATGSVIGVPFGTASSSGRVAPPEQDDKADAISARPSTGVEVGIHRDGRRLRVESWARTWIPGGSGEDDGAVWVDCDPDSKVYAAACDTFDKAPEGPWSD